MAMRGGPATASVECANCSAECRSKEHPMRDGDAGWSGHGLGGMRELLGGMPKQRTPDAGWRCGVVRPRPRWNARIARRNAEAKNTRCGMAMRGGPATASVECANCSAECRSKEHPMRDGDA